MVASLPRKPKPYLGFFNHGLMLHETNTLVDMPKVQIKIQDSRLGHTISRDDVRRDGQLRFAQAEAAAPVAQAISGSAVDLCLLATRRRRVPRPSP